MSLRCLCTALLLVVTVLSTGCCLCHKKHRHCDACSCYSSPASRTQPPAFITIPSADPAK
jgi:hypothetical protein